MFSLSDLLVQVGRRQRRQRGLRFATWFLLSLTCVLWVLVLAKLLAPATSGHLLIYLWIAPVAAAFLVFAVTSRRRLDIDGLLLHIDRQLGTGERLSSLYELSAREGPDIFRYRIEKTLRGLPLPWKRAMPLHRPTLAVLCTALFLWGGLGAMVAGAWGGSPQLIEPMHVGITNASESERDGLSDWERPAAGDDGQPPSLSAHSAGVDPEAGSGQLAGGTVAFPQVDVDDSTLAALRMLEAFISTESAGADLDLTQLGLDPDRREEALARARALLESARSHVLGESMMTQADLDEIKALSASLAEAISEETLAALVEAPVGSSEVRNERTSIAGSLPDSSTESTNDERSEPSSDEDQDQDHDQNGRVYGDSATDAGIGDSGGLDERGAEAPQRPLVSALGSPGFVTEKLAGVLTEATAFRDLLTQGIPVEPVYAPDGEAISALLLNPLRLQAIVEERSLTMRERDLVEAYFRAVTQGGT